MRLPRRGHRQAARPRSARSCGAATAGARTTAAGTTSSSSRRAPTAPAAPRCASGGFDTKTDAERRAATRPGNCWPSPPPATRETAIRIADAITAAMRDTGKLPDPARVRKAVGGGHDPAVRPPTVGEWLEEWLAAKKKLRARHGAQLRRPHPPVPQAAPRAHPDRPAPGHRRRRPCSSTSRNSTTRSPRPAPAAAPRRRAAVKGRRLVGPATCQRIRATLRSAISTYMKQHPGMLPANVASLVELPPGDPAQGPGLDRRAGPRLAEGLRRRGSPPPARPAGGSARVDIWISTPRPSPVMVWTPAQTMVFLDAARTPPAARPVAADRHPGAAPRRGLRAAPPRHRPRHAAITTDPLADHPARLGHRPGRPEIRRRRAHRRPRRRHRRRHRRLAPGAGQGEGSRRGRLGRLRVRVHRRAGSPLHPAAVTDTFQHDRLPRRAAAHPPARPAPRRRDPAAGRRARHESRPGNPRPVVHHHRRRHLHQRAAPARPPVRRGRRRPHPPRRPGPGHARPPPGSGPARKPRGKAAPESRPAGR